MAAVSRTTFPRASDLNVPHTDYPPFPEHPRREWLERALERVTVRGVTAVLFHCRPLWAMPERKIGDDMFFYIVAGRGRMTVEDREHRLEPGVCAHFRRGVRHSAFHDPKAPMDVISLHYTATVFESLTLPELLGFPDFFQVKGDRLFDAMMRKACREHALRPPGHERGLEALACRILLHVAREHGDELHPEAEESRFADLRRLMPALEAARENLAGPLSVGMLARRAGLSEPQFRRVFERTLRVTPVQYVRRLRMERACRLLRRTDRTVESVAGEVGYAEPAFFARTFKQLMGIAPGEYRRRHEL